MKVLLLGTGRQGRAALHDLAVSDEVSAVTAADLDVGAVERYVAASLPGAAIRCEHADARDEGRLRELMAGGHHVVVDMLPVPCHPAVTAAAVDAGLHVVNSSYVDEEIERVAPLARQRGVAVLPELGMDPGIDLVLLGEAVRSLDVVEEIVSYGAGFPEPEAADNPLRYKVTWRFEGVLRSYLRPARVVRDGSIAEIPATEIFAPAQIHEIEVPGLGRLEAFPNGDALRYADLLGLDRSRLRRMERCVLRWPGHSALWKTLVDLHLLDEEPVRVNGAAVDRRSFLAAVLEPQAQYRNTERDVVVVRVEVLGRRDGQRRRIVLQLVDRRDLETGLSAMSRTVGFAASIGAQLIGRGTISGTGLLSPARDVPFEPFTTELGKRGLTVERVDSAA
jgi:saccharopine dehydrogenase-like NADP-dependent oxidoreductase